MIAIALGDLSEGGRVDAETFRSRGNAEYWETRKLIRGNVANWFRDFSDSQDERFREMAAAAKDMLNWAETQTGFLLWQKLRYSDILEHNK